MASGIRRGASPIVRRALSEAAAGSGLYRLAGSLYGGLGVILMLHRVVEAGRPILEPGYEINADVLDGILTKTRSMGWRAVTLDEMHRRLRGNETQGRVVCFTLDDGYLDNLQVALPVFRKHQAPLCTYVSTGLVERSVFYWWGALADLVSRNDRVEWVGSGGDGPRLFQATTWREKQVAYATLSGLCYDADPALVTELLRRHGIDSQEAMARDVLTQAQVRVLAADPLVTIGAHCVSHQRLLGMSDADAAREIEESRRVLEGWTGKELRHMAYPFGGPSACGPREFDLAKRAGFATAVTTRRGNIFPEHGHHLTCLPRRMVPLDVVELRNVLFGVETVLRRWPRLRTV